MLCNFCPRECNIDRNMKKGFCGMGEKPVVAKALLHMWEEPCISGVRGSGAVFFSGCNLKCIFCQNHEISHGGIGKEVSIKELADIFLSLKNKGAHNINLVTPSHFVPAIREALEIAKKPGASAALEQGLPAGRDKQERSGSPLDIPVVYNTNAYDSLESLELLNGSVDIYLPDLKYISPEISLEYSGARNYFDVASRAVFEMYRQVGKPMFDENGILKRGVIIRHLVLPGHTGETLRVLEWIAENLPSDIYVSLMSQFVPCHLACNHPVLGRTLTRYEYEKVTKKFEKLGFKGYIQERGAASDQYIPDFKQEEL